MTDTAKHSLPGTAKLEDNTLRITCFEGDLLVGRVKKEGSKLVTAEEFWNGFAKGASLQFV